MDILKRAGVDRVDRSLIVFHCGDQDHRCFRRGLTGVAQHFNAVVIRHLDVADYNIIQSAVQLFDGGLARGDGFNAMPFFAKRDFQDFADGASIITNQDVTHAPLLPLPVATELSRLWAGPLTPLERRAGTPTGTPTLFLASSSRRYEPYVRARSGIRSRALSRCRLQSATGKARRFFPLTAGPFRNPYRRS